MKYSDLMNRFWNENKNSPYGSSGVAIYTFLVHKWYGNKCMRFTISDVQVSKELKIAVNTLRTFRKELKARQLIDFKIQPGSPCSYTLPVEIPGKEERVPVKKVAEIKKEVVPDSVKKRKTPLKKGKKDLSTLPEEIKSLTPSGTLKADIPSFKEFLSHAKGLKNYVPEADSGIREQYDSWVKNGWNNTYNNTPIVDWKAVLTNNLQYLIDRKLDEDIKLPKITLPKVLNNK